MSMSSLEKYATPIGLALIAVGVVLIALRFIEGRESEWLALPVIGAGIGIIIGQRMRSK